MRLFAPRASIAAITTRAPPAIEFGAVGGEARYGSQGGTVPGGESRCEIAHLAPLQYIPVDPGDGVGNRSHVDLGEVPHRASGADHAAVLRQGRDACIVERLDHVVAQIGHLRGPWGIAAQELISGHERAEIECPPAQRAAAFEVGELEAPAADVDQVSRVDRQTVDGTQECVSRLFLAVDDLDCQPGIGFQPCQDDVPVRRGPHCRGCDRDNALGTGRRCDGAEIAHRGDRLGDGTCFDPAARVDTASELERRSRIRDDVKLTGVIEPQHCDSSRVGPDVDDGERGIYGDHLPGPDSSGSGKYRQGLLLGCH